MYMDPATIFAFQHADGTSIFSTKHPEDCPVQYVGHQQYSHTPDENEECRHDDDAGRNSSCGSAPGTHIAGENRISIAIPTRNTGHAPPVIYQTPISASDDDTLYDSLPKEYSLGLLYDSSTLSDSRDRNSKALAETKVAAAREVTESVGQKSVAEANFACTSSLQRTIPRADHLRVRSLLLVTEVPLIDIFRSASPSPTVTTKQISPRRRAAA